jgi:hypothetical protein
MDFVASVKLSRVALAKFLHPSVMFEYMLKYKDFAPIYHLTDPEQSKQAYLNSFEMRYVNSSCMFLTTN